MECTASHVLSCASRTSDRFHLLVSLVGLLEEGGRKLWLNIQARCLRAGKFYLFKLRDVKGAFTNVAHDSLQQHLEATQRPPEAAIHRNSGKPDANWSQVKNRAFSGGWDQTPGFFLPNVVQEPCWGRVAFHRQSGTLCADWNHCDAHQLLQICRFMEIKTCLDQSKKDRLPGSDQRGWDRRE